MNCDRLGVRQQAQLLCDIMLKHHMNQYVDQVTHGKEILDLCFSNNHDLISHISTEGFPLFTDHRIFTATVSYKANQRPLKEEIFLLDSGRRLSKLDFSKAPWPTAKQELSRIDWNPMISLANRSLSIAYTWFL